MTAAKKRDALKYTWHSWIRHPSPSTRLRLIVYAYAGQPVVRHQAGPSETGQRQPNKAIPVTLASRTRHGVINAEATKSPASTHSGTEHATGPTNPALAAEAKIARLAVTIFPALAVLAGVAGFLVPAAFQPMAPSVPYLLGIFMFCMGLT